MLKKAQDASNKGYFETYSPEWAPLTQDKVFWVNMGVFGALGMSGSTVNSPPLIPVKLQVWVEPHNLTVADGGTATYQVKVQNQGFATEQVRIGGLMALSRWMDPGEFHLELIPHQLHT